MNIRLATLEDAPGIYKINKNELGYDIGLEQTKQNIAEILPLPNHRIWIMEIDGQVAGLVHAETYLSTIMPNLVHVMELAVSSDFQGKGIGRKLLDQVESWTKEIGFAGIKINSGETRKEAHKFYQHVGYTKVKYQAYFRKMF